MKRFPLAPLVAGAVIALDQVTKWLALEVLPHNQPVAWMPFWRDLLRLTRITTPSILFGLFKENGTFVVALVLTVLAAGLYFARRVPRRERWAQIGFGLLAGGALSNLIDRLRQGSATSFIDFKYAPIVNLADAAMVAGLVLLLMAFWIDRRAGVTSGGDSS